MRPTQESSIRRQILRGARTAVLLLLACVAAGCGNVSSASSSAATTEELTQGAPAAEDDPTPRECDAAQGSVVDIETEPDWRAYANYRAWADTRGCLIRIDILADRPGPAHCGYENTRVIIMGQDYGEPYTSVADAVEYVKDPAGAYGDPQLADAYRSDSPLPRDAVDSGARLQDTALWLDPDEEFVYLVGPEDTQWLPRGTATACA